MRFSEYLLMEEGGSQISGAMIASLSKSGAEVPFLFTRLGELHFGEGGHEGIINKAEFRTKYSAIYPQIYHRHDNYDKYFLTGRIKAIGAKMSGVFFNDTKSTQDLIDPCVWSMSSSGLFQRVPTLQVITSNSRDDIYPKDVADIAKREPKPEVTPPSGPRVIDKEKYADEDQRRRREEFLTKKGRIGDDDPTAQANREREAITWMRKAGMDQHGNPLPIDGSKRWRLSTWRDYLKQNPNKGLPQYPPDWGVEGKMKK